MNSAFQSPYQSFLIKVCKPIAMHEFICYNRCVVQGYSSVGRAAVSKTACPEFESLCPCQKIQVARLGFFHLRRRHNLICMEHATSFRAKREHHCCPAAQMNEVALCANDVLRNDVMLRINDVALCANGIQPLARCAEI